MKKEVKRDKTLQEVEALLRNGKLPDANASKLRGQVWQRVVAKQRERRTRRGPLGLAPWSWALASILVILIAILILVLLK